MDPNLLYWKTRGQVTVCFTMLLLPVSHNETVISPYFFFNVLMRCKFFSVFPQSNTNLVRSPRSNRPALLWGKEQPLHWSDPWRPVQHIWCLTSCAALLRLKYRRPALFLELERKVKRLDEAFTWQCFVWRLDDLPVILPLINLMLLDLPSLGCSCTDHCSSKCWKEHKTNNIGNVS